MLLCSKSDVFITRCVVRVIRVISLYRFKTLYAIDVNVNSGVECHCLRYLDRFTVKLSLVGDMDYKLQALKAAVPEAEKKLGEQTTGTFDLTQESITAVYTPD